MELHKPKNLYELLTLNMEQRFANRVAFRWYDADQDVVVEKHFGEYAQDIRRAVNYYLSTIPDIQGKRVCVWSNNSYHYAVNCYGDMMAGGVIVLLGKPGRHLATGMHGGVIYLKHRIADDEVSEGLVQEPVDEADRALIRSLLERYNGFFAADLGAPVDATGEGFFRLRPATARPYASMYAN